MILDVELNSCAAVVLTDDIIKKILRAIVTTIFYGNKKQLF